MEQMQVSSVWRMPSKSSASHPWDTMAPHVRSTWAFASFKYKGVGVFRRCALYSG